MTLDLSLQTRPRETPGLDIGVPLATSRDGTRLVVEKDREIRIIDLKR